MGVYGEPDQATLVGMQVAETLQWCLRTFAGNDQAAAAMGLVSVQYSPLTCSVAESLHTLMEYQPLSYWPEGSQALVEQVLGYASFSSPHLHAPV